MYHILWYFFLYAFFGWCTEVSYAALNTGRFVNRGFLNGPVCPVYGFGALIVLTLLSPLKDYFVLLFFGSVLLTSALEWLTGFLLEKLFHQRWWDYSEQPFNLNGYICLKFSIAWGIACLCVVNIIHPSVTFLIHLIPQTLGWIILSLFGVFMAIDLIATVRTVTRFNLHLKEIEEAAALIREASNEFGESLADRVLDAAEKGADLKDTLDNWKEDLDARWDEFSLDAQMEFAELQEDITLLRDSLAEKRAAAELARAERRAQLLERAKTFRDALDFPVSGQHRLLRAFPGLRSTHHAQALEHLRRRLGHRDKKD